MIARQLAAVDLIRKFPVPMLTVAVVAKRCKSFFSCRAVKSSDMVREEQQGVGGLRRELKACKQRQWVDEWGQVASPTNESSVADPGTSHCSVPSNQFQCLIGAPRIDP